MNSFRNLTVLTLINDHTLCFFPQVVIMRGKGGPVKEGNDNEE